MMAAPTLVATSGDVWTTMSGSSRTTGTVAWQTGDLIVVLGMTEDSSVSLGTPTATGLSFSSLSGYPTGNVSCCKGYIWTATAANNGSSAISASVTGSSMGNLQVYVYRGSDGVGVNGNVTRTSALTLSLARSSDNSAVVAALGDWNAVNDTTVTPVPASGGVQDQAAYVSGRATMFAFHWTDQGVAATTSYGVSGITGTSMSIIALEVKGTTAVSPTGQMKVWDGSAFTAKPAKVWDGTAWTTKPVKRWDGTTWTETDY